jgi:hypothetical protein
MIGRERRCCRSRYFSYASKRNRIYSFAERRDRTPRKIQMKILLGFLRRQHLPYCQAALNWVFLNLWAGQWLGRKKAFYGPLF